MCCCSDGDRAEGVPSSSGRGRIRALFAWVLPITTLALIPKCPACVAGYVLFLTGIGLSLSAATMLRGGVIALSLVALAYLVFRATRRLLSPTP